MKEIWKDVPEYEGMYQASNFGKIKSLERSVNNNGGERVLPEKIMSQRSFTRKGRTYLTVNLSKYGRRKTFRVHVLIAKTFLGRRPDKFVIDHINNIPTDNRASNLQYITSRENTSKDRKGGTSRFAGVHWCKAKRKWKANIRIDGKRVNLGSYDNENEAGMAYIIAKKRY